MEDGAILLGTAVGDAVDRNHVVRRRGVQAEVQLGDEVVALDVGELPVVQSLALLELHLLFTEAVFEFAQRERRIELHSALPEDADKILWITVRVDDAHDIVCAREVFKAQQDVDDVGEAAAVDACELGSTELSQEGRCGQAHVRTPDRGWIEFGRAIFAVQSSVPIGNIIGKRAFYRVAEGVQRLCHPPVRIASDLSWRAVVRELPSDPLEGAVDSVFEAERPLVVHFSREPQVLEERRGTSRQVIPALHFLFPLIGGANGPSRL